MRDQKLSFGTLPVTRRRVLRWGIIGGTLVIVPTGTLIGCGDDDNHSGPRATPTVVPPTATPTPGFLTDEEQRVLTAVSARIIPTDDLPGATEAGAANYIAILLSELPDESSPGRVFAGGPFSGRTPFPDPATGEPSDHFPADAFAQFVPLTRVQLLSWRAMLLGSAAVPGADFNDAVLGPTTGLHDRYRAGLAEVQAKSAATFGADFDALTPDQQDQILAGVTRSFVDLVTGHTIEGMFCSPEYGGNTDQIGWTLIRYDGDSQPLGYSIFDERTKTYKELPDKPNSTADPDDDFSGVDANTQAFLAFLVRILGGFSA
jgi:gluconate 2-dehydrogenase gamma chain